MKLLKNIFIPALCCAALFAYMAIFLPDTAFAQQEYQVLQSIGEIGPTYTATGDLGSYITSIFGIALGIAGVLAVLMIVIGGIQYMASGNNPGQKNLAKERITAAILGLLLVASSVLILTVINPNLLNFQLELELSGDFSGGTSPVTDTTDGTNGCSSSAVNAGYGRCIWRARCVGISTPIDSSYCTEDSPDTDYECCGYRTKVFGLCFTLAEGNEIYYISYDTQNECSAKASDTRSSGGTVVQDCQLVGRYEGKDDVCPVESSCTSEGTESGYSDCAWQRYIEKKDPLTSYDLEACQGQFGEDYTSVPKTYCAETEPPVSIPYKNACCAASN